MSQLQELYNKLAVIEEERKKASATQFVNSNLINLVGLAGLLILGIVLFKTNFGDISYAQSKCSADAEYYYQFCQTVINHKTNWLSINTRVIAIGLGSIGSIAAILKLLWIQNTADEQLDRLNHLITLEREFHDECSRLDINKISSENQILLEGIVEKYTQTIHSLPPTELHELNLQRDATTKIMTDVAFQNGLPEQLYLQ